MGYFIKIVLCISIFFFIQCKQDKKIEDHSCSFELLKSESVTIETKDGHQINLEAEAKIKANVKKLAELEGTIKASDSIYVNLERSLSRKEITYALGFIDDHDAKLNFICGLEKKLKDPTLPTEIKSILTKQLINAIEEYYKFVFNKGKNIDKNSTIDTKSNPLIESNTDAYFNKNIKTDVAILVDSDNKKAGALTSSAVSNYFSEKGLANNPVFFRTPFISKFSDRLKDNDVSIFNSLDVQKTANCVCVIHQDDYKIENQTYDNNELKKASASYHITLFYLNGSGSPQTFQLDAQGAGANESMAQESLTDHFINLFKNQSIHFNQCKK